MYATLCSKGVALANGISCDPSQTPSRYRSNLYSLKKKVYELNLKYLGEHFLFGIQKT